MGASSLRFDTQALFASALPGQDYWGQIIQLSGVFQPLPAIVLGLARFLISVAVRIDDIPYSSLWIAAQALRQECALRRAGFPYLSYNQRRSQPESYISVAKK